MEKTYRAYEPDQLFLLPPALQDWVPEGHLVHFISDVVDQVDLRGARRSTLSSPDDDEAAAVRLCDGGPFLPQDRAAL